MGARSSQSRGPGLNKSDGHLLEYFRTTFVEGGGASVKDSTITNQATGGTKTTSGLYTIHTFTASGSLVV